jgi:hypothetical protein
VTATRSHNRIATVAVDAVWKGDVANSLEVFGVPDRDDALTTVDRTYDIGARYLILAFEPAAHGSPGTFGGHYEDNACSGTQPWSDKLAEFRPATVTTVPPATSSASSAPNVQRTQSTGSSPWFVVAVAVIIGIVVAAVGWRRSRRGRGFPGPA